MSQFMQPGIILLKDGTEESQGKGHIISNINACCAVGEIVRTTLGPRGMDKLVHKNGKATISNDGASIMKLLDIVHPAAKTLTDISLAQDAEVGDGTTSVVLLACELLKSSKAFIEDGIHPQTIIRGLRQASVIAVEAVKDLAQGVDQGDAQARNKLLEKCAGTALNSKLICRNKAFFSPLCVKAVTSLEKDMNLNLIGIKKVTGGSVTDSCLLEGIAFKKTFSYAGFEQQKKYFENPKVLLLNVELELKSEKENAEVRIDNPDKYQAIVDAEWQIIFDKLDKCVASGAHIILSKLPIGDLATQYFADRGLFCAGRVPAQDLERCVQAMGGVIQTTCNGLTDEILGQCKTFEERQIGNERYNIFLGCAKGLHASTIILRGGADQFLEEAERSLHDALMVVRRAVKSTKVVAGGGAVEMHVMCKLRSSALKISSKLQLVMLAFAKSLEVIPRQLCDNAGFDSTDILNRLRQKHAKYPEEGKWFGVDVENEGICDTMQSGVWEPADNKINSFSSACEAACLILSVDQTVRNPQSEQAQMQGRGQMPQGGMRMANAGMAGMMQGAGGMRTMKGRRGR